jgi:hypothetical protein
VHLFSPGADPVVGKVYVGCKMCKPGKKVGSPLVLVVDPWELLLELGDRSLVEEVLE